MRLPAAIAFACWVALIACDPDSSAVVAALESGCLLDSNCESGLVCLFRVCHQPCDTSEDCPQTGGGEHQPCVVGDKPIRVCLFDEEASCGAHSDCPGDLLCGIDATCRTPCGGDRDCIPGQLCVGGTCAEKSEVQATGKLTAAPEGPRAGAACVHHSDCLPTLEGTPQRCRGGSCEVACLGDDRDCGRFERCSTSDGITAGACELIGQTGALYCSPKDDFPEEQQIACSCPDGAEGVQVCQPDGSSYGPCTVGITECVLP